MAPRQRKLYPETESLRQYSRLSQIKRNLLLSVMRSGDDERFFVCDFLKQPGGVAEGKKICAGALLRMIPRTKAKQENLDAAR